MKKSIRTLFDLNKVDLFLKRFNKSTGLGTAILDLDGNVISQSGCSPICAEFHRTNPDTSKRCTISNPPVMKNKMRKGEKYHFFKCRNGLMVASMPLKINGEHVANLFSCEFFFERPDDVFFLKQAKEFGFDEKKYFDALGNVQVISEDKVKTEMDILYSVTEYINDLSIQKQELAELKQSLKESNRKFSSYFENDITGNYLASLNGKIILCNNESSPITLFFSND